MEHQMQDTVLLGTSVMDITPQKPMPLSGFSFRSGNFESVRTGLSLRCFVFRYDDGDVAVLSADILCWGRDTLANCRAALERDIPDPGKRRYLFLATHTHCGPAVSYYYAGGLGKPDEDYVRYLIDQTVAAVRKAMENFLPVKGFLYRGKTAIPLNRRLKTDAGYEMAPNPLGQKNDDIKIIEFISAKEEEGIPAGAPAALWAMASCHPTSSGDNRVDREFLVRGLDYFMEQRAPGIPSAFIQGCCGDTRPPLVRDGQFYRGSLDGESEDLANQFAGELAAAAGKPGIPLSFNSADVLRTSTAYLPLNPGFRHNERFRYAHLADAVGEWARHFQDAPVPETMPLKLFYLNLTREFGMMFLSGEVVSEYSLYCKEASRDRLWTGAYAGGMTTYIPSAEQLAEGGYEPYDAMFYYLQPAPFHPGLEKVLKHVMSELAGLR